MDCVIEMIFTLMACYYIHKTKKNSKIELNSEIKIDVNAKTFYKNRKCNNQLIISKTEVFESIVNPKLLIMYMIAAYFSGRYVVFREANKAINDFITKHVEYWQNYYYTGEENFTWCKILNPTELKRNQLKNLLISMPQVMVQVS